MRNIILTALILVVASLSIGSVPVVTSFTVGRDSINQSALLAVSDDVSPNDMQQEDKLSMPEFDPLHFAQYKVSYLKEAFDESSAVHETVSFFAGTYRLPVPGYYHIAATSRGDLDGDGIEEGAAMKVGNFGGAGTFTELVVLKHSGLGFTEFASTSEPYEFLADRIDVQSVQILDKRITVKIIGKGPEDAGCCPTVPMEKSFRLSGSSLVPN